MPVRQVLNTVYSRVIAEMEPKQRREFDDELYGWSARNEAANNVLRDVRDAGAAMTTERGSEVDG